MSFAEFFNATSGLGEAYTKGLKTFNEEEGRRELAKIYGSQLEALGGGTSAASTAPTPLPALGQATPSFAGGNSPKRMPTDPAIEQRFIGALKDGGLTNPYGLGAVAAYANHESGYSPSNIGGSWSDPSERGAAGTSGGILSWRNERLANMRRQTAGAADPVVAQAKFTLTENPDLTMALQNAKSPEEANQLMANAWKFAGYNRPGGENAARLASTQAYSSRLGVDAAQPAGQSRMAPQQVAGGDPDLPVPGAVAVGSNVPPGFRIPGQEPSFEPGTVASPAIGAQPAISAQQAVAAPPRVSQQDRARLQAMLQSRSPEVQKLAIEQIQKLSAPEEYGFQTVGDQLYRTSKRGGVEAVGITKSPTYQTQKGSDGNDYTFSPQTGQWTRAIEGKSTAFTDLVTPEDRAAAGISPSYNGPAQRGPDGEIRLPGKASTEINLNNASEKAQDQKIGAAYGDTFNALQEQGRTAPGQINTLRLMEKLIESPNFYSGTGSTAYLAAQRAATALGIKDAASSAPNELFAKLANQSVVDKLGGSLGSGVSNADVSFITRITANPENTPEGNRQILQFGKALAQRQIDVAKLARAYAGTHQGRLDAGFDEQLADWAEKNPLKLEMTAAQKAAEQKASAAPAQPSFDRGSLESEARRRGLIR